MKKSDKRHADDDKTTPKNESEKVENVVETENTDDNININTQNSTQDDFIETDDIEKYLKYDEEAEKNDAPLPQAEKSDDIYADIIKNTKDGGTFEENTSRRMKYRGEQHFVDVDNPFQRDKEKEEIQLRETVPADTVENNPSKSDKQVKTFNEIFSGLAHKFFPNKKDAKPEFIRKLVMNISVYTLIGCAIAFGVIYAQGNNSEKQQSNLSSQIVDVSNEEEEAKIWEDFHSKYPDIKTPEGMMAKYAYLYALNQQLVGWISVPNSGIDVQVVQSTNNTDYLKKDFYGNYSRYGCPFLDYRNDPKYLNQNTIIYGHHMSDGLVFAELSKYKTLDGFVESPVIEFDTLYKSYKFKVYAAFITNSKAEDDNGYVFNYTVTSFISSDNFNKYVDALDERKLYTTGVDINSSDKLITLSTCSYEFSDARLVVVGRMLRTGETADVDTTYSVTNGNPHYPQIWYDQNGKTNPYANADKWYPES